MVFSKNVPEPACSINQQQQQKYVEFKINSFEIFKTVIYAEQKKPHVGTETTTFSSFKNKSNASKVY